MIRDEYSPFKIIHHSELIETFRKGKEPNPIQVHFVPTNRCNQRCSFCSYRMKGYSSAEQFDERDHIPQDKCLSLLNSMAKLGVKAIQFTGGGEPLVHEGIKEMFDVCVERQMEIALVTNGVNLKGDLLPVLGTHASWVRVSLDAGTSETYAKIRRVPEKQFSAVLNNIKELAGFKSSLCRLGVGFVVTKDNCSEIYQAAHMVKELGVDNFRISALFSPEGASYFTQEEKHTIHDECMRVVRELGDERFTVFNLFDARQSDLDTKSPQYTFCPMKSLVPYLAADMNVYTCCILAYNKQGLIGSVREQDFNELWNSEGKKKMFARHNPLLHCKSPCMFDKKNDFINYCIKKDPLHINYI